MKKIELTTTSKKLLADVFTPVGIYLRLRDRFRDTILMESSDFHAGENSYSFIGINAIAGIEIKNLKEIEYKFPNEEPKKIAIKKDTKVADELWKFMQYFNITGPAEAPVNLTQGLFGYTTYNAIGFFEDIALTSANIPKSQNDNPGFGNLTSEIPLIRYRLYQYVIAINHFKNELFICENHLKGIESNIDLIESIIRSKDVPAFPFAIQGTESSSLKDDEYIAMVDKGIASCARGDVFQIVLGRKFQQKFLGDEFNVYRALRNINPSPYLFYFDYGDYRLFGSSPEAQLVIKNNIAVMHPIAGTSRRTGNDATDEQLSEELLKDKKENAEHVMLVDLARNDLSRICSDVHVSRFCEVQYFSHVIHLVSEVKGTVKEDANPFDVLGVTFPAGTLSGAPKYKAMQLIDEFENDSRSYYGGCIGFVGFNGNINHAIMIRTFLSKNNCLNYRAGAGITISSIPGRELKEVTNKLNALTAAIQSAQNI
ncbi:MAG: anthranilate synthase component I family protein [Ginsengibacter sp.]